ncbi:GH13177 [Drosophila grimshawi]|uniref:GH13177 n=2 Tax=Drosophila grimshawi TaxID=7222 RepID=B4JQI6_DROGR|nr:GH13177 [Drosophila grimshawi]
MTQFCCIVVILLICLTQFTGAETTPKPKAVTQAAQVTTTTTTVRPSLKQQQAQPQQQQKKQDPKCLQPLETGPCRMKLERYYYNKDKNACETFNFGGCRGNDNRWGFRQTCEDACLLVKK